MHADLERLRALTAAIADAAAHAHRPPDAVRLLAVSKGVASARLRALYGAGQRCFGESYAQEAAGKIDELADLPIEWHFIGPLQSNKTRLVATRCAWVHSVDRHKTIERLAAQRPADQAPLQVCLQIRLDDNAAKAGCRPPQLAELAAAVRASPRLRLRGLMALPARSDDPLQQRAAFRTVRLAQESLLKLGYKLDTLSMGMSGDFPAAIAEGATLIRIGSALFGPRPRRP